MAAVRHSRMGDGAGGRQRGRRSIMRNEIRILSWERVAGFMDFRFLGGYEDLDYSMGYYSPKNFIHPQII